jgi:UDP-N-acetylmuramate dehydrogenase
VTIQEDVQLAPYTTLGAGGPARWFFEARTDDEVVEAARFARGRGLPLFVLGGGSNLLVSDEGFRGVVIRIGSSDSVCVDQGNGTACIFADAGADWDDVVRLAVEKNCAGIECLAGIPGGVGGTPVQNVGAYGQEVSHSIVSVRALDLEAGSVVELSAADCGFTYRRSIFNTTLQGRYAITRVLYSLKLDGAPHLEYRDVKLYFAERGIAQPTLADAADAVRAIRARKGMLLDPADPDSRSAGSFFKNPVVPVATVSRLAVIAGCAVGEIPQFPTGSWVAAADQMVRLSAAWLIELAGFRKGFTAGRVGISTKHLLAIVNRGGASAAEIVALRDLIVEQVYAKTSIRLEQEPVMLGFPLPR